jgi:hypothetical protein
MFLNSSLVAQLSLQRDGQSRRGGTKVRMGGGRHKEAAPKGQAGGDAPPNTPWGCWQPDWLHGGPPFAPTAAIYTRGCSLEGVISRNLNFGGLGAAAPTQQWPLAGSQAALAPMVKQPDAASKASTKLLASTALPGTMLSQSAAVSASSARPRAGGGAGAEDGVGCSVHAAGCCACLAARGISALAV